MVAGTQDGGRFAANAAIPSWASGAAKKLADLARIRVTLRESPVAWASYERAP